MKLDRARRMPLTLHPFAMGALVAVGAVTACHVYVDEPARPAPPSRPAPPPPPPPAPPPAPPKDIKISPIHLNIPGAPPASSGTKPAPATCVDTGAATVGDCAAMQSPNGCATVPTPQQKCNAYKTNFIPKVAAAAVSCMVALNGAQLCDGTSISTCARTALAQACPAPAVTQLCQIAATPCKTTAADCVSVLSGLSDQGQQAVAQCVAQGCATGLSACIDGLAATGTAGPH